MRSVGCSSRSKAKERVNSSKILSMSGKKASKAEQKQEGSSKMPSLALTSMLVFLILLAGTFYLYQVNDLATKGYEIRDIENQIQTLEKDSKKMKIKEVELRSMYNIEKSTQELNLISPQNVTYVEMDSSVAMK
jgi:hypothetical protein